MPGTSLYNSGVASQNVTVNPATPTINFPALSPQTALSTAVLSATSTPSGQITFASTTPSVCTVSGTTASFLIAGTCTLTASVPATGVYQAASASQSVTVSLAAETISFTPLGPQTALGNASLNASSPSNGAITFTSSTPAVCVVSGTTASFLTAGTCTLTASVAATATYQAATSSQSVTVNLASETINFSPLGPQTAASSVALRASSSPSNGAITFASSTPTVCTVVGTAATFLIAGTCTVTASVPATAVYQSATASQTITVNLAPDTINFGPLGNHTATSSALLTATSPSNGTITFASSTPAVCTVSGTTASFITAGACTLTASVPGNATYQSATASQTITVNLAPEAVTFPALGPQTATTSATLHASSPSNGVITFASTTPTVCTVSGTTASFLIAGTCTLTASVPANATYQGTATSQNVTVALAAETISFTAVGSQTALSSAALHATSPSNGAVAFASTTPSVCTVSGTTATFLIAGTCMLTASVPANATYQSATATQSFTVTLAPQSVTFTALSTQTAGTTATLSATSPSKGVIAFASSTPAICTVSGSVANFLTGGTCVLTASVPANATYQSASAQQSVTVIQKTQTITFKLPASQLQGTPLTLTAMATSVLPVSFTSLTPAICTISGTTATLAHPGTCTIQASQAGNAIYAAAPAVSESLTVIAAFTITPTPPSETVLVGTLGAFTLQLQQASGFTGKVTLSCAGPAGSYCTNFPMTVSFLNGKALAVSAIFFPLNTPPGSYTVTFTGASGSITDTGTATFIVKGL